MVDLALKRYFYKNYGGHMVHQFKAEDASLELIVHESFYDVGVAVKPVSQSFVRFWYVKKGRKKILEGNNAKSLNEYLMRNNIKLLDELEEEVVFNV